MKFEPHVLLANLEKNFTNIQLSTEMNSLMATATIWWHVL